MFRDFVLGSPAPAGNPFCPAGGLVCPILPASNPENTYTLGLAYTLPIPEAAGQVTFNADYYHQSGVTSVDAGSGVLSVGVPYDVLNASLTWREVMGSQIDATFFVWDLLTRQL